MCCPGRHRRSCWSACVVSFSWRRGAPDEKHGPLIMEYCFSTFFWFPSHARLFALHSQRYILEQSILGGPFSSVKPILNGLSSNRQLLWQPILDQSIFSNPFSAVHSRTIHFQQSISGPLPTPPCNHTPIAERNHNFADFDQITILHYK